MDDTISRQAAIDVLCDNCDHVEAVCSHYPCKQYIAIESLPSAQPEISCSEIPNSSDAISRQAAIDLWEQYHPYIATKACEYDTMLRQLPSAQPEPLTEIDAVKREDVVDILHRIMQGRSDSEEDLIGEIVSEVDLLPLVQPYTEDEIQKMQDLEQAQLDKAFELGKQAAQSEIIRCKDCEWFRKEYGWNCIEYTVCGISPTHHPIRREDDFCSYAERRTNG